MSLANEKVLFLSLGDQTASVVTLGGGLRSYSAQGRDLVDGYPEGQPAPGGAGQILAPWPNRVEDGRYLFHGVSHQLAVNEPKRNNALHGLVRDLRWRMVSQAPERVELSCELSPTPGYPFALLLSVRWSLSEQGLRAEHQVINQGAGPCPFGLGAHPYLLPASGTLDEQVLTLPAEVHLRHDDRFLPRDQEPVSGTPWDFRQGRRLDTQVLDDAFELPGCVQGRNVVRLQDPQGRGAELWMDDAFPLVQLYSGDTLPPDRRRRSLAVEPMTCPANAFRSNDHLLVLEPGEVWTGSWGIFPLG